VLTRADISGAEEFSIPQELKRATIIGDTGGAHRRHESTITHDRGAIREAVNPIRRPLEGTGVEPDVKVPAMRRWSGEKMAAEQMTRRVLRLFEAPISTSSNADSRLLYLNSGTPMLSTPSSSSGYNQNVDRTRMTPSGSISDRLYCFVNSGSYT